LGELSPHALSVFDALREAAADVLAAGLARLEVDVEDGEGDVSLVPTREGAAPLRVQVDHERQLTIYPGASGMVYEEWSKRPGELLDAVRDAVRCVIAGGYSEEVRLAPDGSLRKGKGWFARPGRDPERIRYSDWTVEEGGDWERREYVPYA
jgi:hypothetical protein